MKNLGLKISLSANVLLLVGLVALALAGTFLLTRFAEQHRERRETQFEQLDPRGGIVFVGDSITEGGVWHELFARTDVWNRGVGGDTTSHLLARLDSVVAIEPRQIFLMIGVNDLNRGVSPALSEKNYGEILDTLAQRLPECEIVVQSVLPVSRQWPYAGNDEIRALNETIRKTASERGLVYIDLHEALADPEGQLPPSLSNDGIHLLGSAYSIWRDAIADRLLAPE